MNFAGIVVIHKFTPDEISHWRGFDWTGLPEGLLVQSNRPHDGLGGKNNGNDTW